MINEAVKTLQERRTVRCFDSRELPEQAAEVLLQVAADSPTARNMQRCHFTLVQDKALLQHMSDLIRQQMLEKGNDHQKHQASNPDYDPLHHAPALLFVNGDVKASFHVHTDCGVAAGLVVAAAEEMGLSTCIIASSLFMFQSEEGVQLKEKLCLPEGYQTVCTVAIGYRKGDKPARPVKRDPAEFTVRL